MQRVQFIVSAYTAAVTECAGECRLSERESFCARTNDKRNTLYLTNLKIPLAFPCPMWNR
jgi:hypothetical protein